MLPALNRCFSIGPFQVQMARIITLSLGFMFCSGLVACRRSAGQAATTREPNEDVAAVSKQPDLSDFWDGHAEFVLIAEDSGLPMGESDTVTLQDGQIWSYVHASHQSLGVTDQCGDPVEFPGCVVRFESTDSGMSFHPVAGADGALVCMMPCAACPCESERDHIDQQQYPRLATAGDQTTAPADAEWLMLYEYRANTFLMRSADGLSSDRPEQVPLTGIWKQWLMACRSEEGIHPHPNISEQYDCLRRKPTGPLY